MRDSNEHGISLIELTIAASVMTIALFLITSNSMSGVGTLRSMARVADNAERVGNVVHGIEKFVRGGTGFRPTGWLIADAGSSPSAILEVDTVRGFPDIGTLVVNPGTAGQEILDYSRARDDGTARVFAQLERGQRGTAPRSHATGSAVRWAEFGEVLNGTPSPGTFDGQSSSVAGPVFFRGQGTGFVFQRSIPIGATRRLGAVVDGTAEVDGWSAIYFEPVTQLTESDRNRDLNRDGDLDDVFDLGRLRRRSWSPIALTTDSMDLPVSPTAIVQEQGNWGTGDLDGDGNADPMFLWHDRSSKLQIQMVFWVGREGRSSQFIKVNSAVRLDR